MSKPARFFRVTSYSSVLGYVTTTVTATSMAGARRAVGGRIYSIEEVKVDLPTATR